MPSFGFAHKKREKQKPIPCEEAQQFTSLFQVPIKKNTHTKRKNVYRSNDKNKHTKMQQGELP